MDGVGEWTTTSLAMGNGKDLQVIREIHFPHSLGLLYSAFTYYTGFKVNSGEYKVMGLAPYGEPKYVQQIRDHLIDIKDGWQLQAESRLLRVLHRPYDDQWALRSALRRTAAQTRIAADAT